MIRQLQPWYENIAKRQVKAPKIYLRDSGLLMPCSTSRFSNPSRLSRAGASWEGFAIEQVLQTVRPSQADSGLHIAGRK